MTRTIILPLTLLDQTCLSAQSEGVYPNKRSKPETDDSAAFEYESKFIEIGGDQLDYTEFHVGKGIHFLPESHPTSISASINKWYQNL